jgi:hypothetical protein
VSAIYGVKAKFVYFSLLIPLKIRNEPRGLSRVQRSRSVLLTSKRLIYISGSAPFALIEHYLERLVGLRGFYFFCIEQEEGGRSGKFAKKSDSDVGNEILYFST